MMDASPHSSHYVNANGIRLHYLDWGGSGPAIVFLSGMGCSVHIFDEFAPRFADRFHVLAVDRRGHGDSDYPETGYDEGTLAKDLRQFLDAINVEKVILVGHSMAYIELCHFSALYPERVSKLVFLDAAYYNSSPETKAVMEKNPLRSIQLHGLRDEYDTVEDYIADIQKVWPALAAVWGEPMDEQIRHTVKTNPQGKVVDKMSDAIGEAIHETFNNYVAEYSEMRAPVLSLYSIRDGTDYLSSEYMTEEMQARVLDFFNNDLQPVARAGIERFRREVPHARIVVIPHGHHYCFLKHKELVFLEMRRFLLEGDSDAKGSKTSPNHRTPSEAAKGHTR